MALYSLYSQTALSMGNVELIYFQCFSSLGFVSLYAT